MNESVMPRAYLARVEPGKVHVVEQANGAEVDAFDVPPGASLRAVLADHGWSLFGGEGNWHRLLVFGSRRRRAAQ